MELFINIVKNLIPLFILLPGLLLIYKVSREMQNSDYGFCLKLLNDGNPLPRLDYVRQIKTALAKIEDEGELILLRVEANRQQIIHTDFNPLAQFFTLNVIIISAVFTLLKFTGGDNILWLTKNYSTELWALGIMILMSFFAYGTLLISNFRIYRADAEVLKELVDLRIEELHAS